jgi:hypothetical protein
MTALAHGLRRGDRELSGAVTADSLVRSRILHSSGRERLEGRRERGDEAGEEEAVGKEWFRWAPR